MKKCAWLVCHHIEIKQRSSISVREILRMFFLFYCKRCKMSNSCSRREMRKENERIRKNRNPNYTFQMVSQSVSQSTTIWATDGHPLRSSKWPRLVPLNKDFLCVLWVFCLRSLDKRRKDATRPQAEIRDSEFDRQAQWG